MREGKGERDKREERDRAATRKVGSTENTVRLYEIMANQANRPQLTTLMRECVNPDSIKKKKFPQLLSDSPIISSLLAASNCSIPRCIAQPRETKRNCDRLRQQRRCRSRGTYARTNERDGDDSRRTIIEARTPVVRARVANLR